MAANLWRRLKEPAVADAVRYHEIPWAPGYRVGSDGTVWCCRHRRNTPAGASAEWRPLKLTTMGDGYLFATFRPKPHMRSRGFPVHRLVLQAFVGPRPEGHEGRHLDGDKTNNRLENLAWGTVSENQLDRYRHGTMRLGEQCAGARLTAELVRECRRLRAEGWTLDMLGRRYGVTFHCISRVVRGETWRHVC